MVERDHNAMYRVEVIDPGGYRLYKVTAYGRVPGPIDRAPALRFDILPAWLQDAIRMMDSAGDGYEVAGIGKRLSAHLYWVISLDVDDKSA